ncbi:unnamed protein product [Pleuronectes platessa]|uniref:Uncharacterized protein n=1 Tax=Pleuronectes platessa TaxID=8262 RepID=A0A9N7Z266_PLEPL|nr:unnamed protein product [Pleuronectes platessa]
MWRTANAAQRADSCTRPDVCEQNVSTVLQQRFTFRCEPSDICREPLCREGRDKSQNVHPSVPQWELPVAPGTFSPQRQLSPTTHFLLGKPNQEVKPLCLPIMKSSTRRGGSGHTLPCRRLSISGCAARLLRSGSWFSTSDSSALHRLLFFNVTRARPQPTESLCVNTLRVRQLRAAHPADSNEAFECRQDSMEPNVMRMYAALAAGGPPLLS